MPARIDIPKEELERLYWKEGLSLNKASSIMQCSKRCFQQNMARNNLPRRTRITALRRSRKSILPQQFKKNSYSYKYLCGISYGDGCLTGRALQLFAKDNDFVNNFIKQGKALGFKPTILTTKLKRKKSPLFGSQICNKALVDLIRNSKLKISTTFINGFIDSEACVSHCKYTRQITIHNTDFKLLSKISEFLTNKFIENRICTRKNVQPYQINQNHCNIKKYIYYILICGSKNLKSFKNIFKFSIIRKQEKLLSMISSYQPPLKKPTKDTLFELYVLENKTQKEIAKIYNISNSTIQKEIEKHGILRR